jgi:hypothetical protein
MLFLIFDVVQGRKVMQMMVGTPKGSKPVQQQQQQQQEEEGTQQQQHGSNSSSSITSLPAPTDPDVRLAVAGGELVAVLFFEGYITPEAAAAARQKLTQALTAGESGPLTADCCILGTITTRTAPRTRWLNPRM